MGERLVQLSLDSTVSHNSGNPAVGWLSGLAGSSSSGNELGVLPLCQNHLRLTSCLLAG